MVSSPHLYDEVMDGIMENLENREVFGVHGHLPGESPDFVDLTASLFAENDEFEDSLRPPPTKAARMVEPEDVKPFIRPILDDNTATASVRSPVALSGTVRSSPNTPAKTTTSPKKDDRVQVMKDRRISIPMIYIKRNLTSWSDRESYFKSDCKMCRDAYGKIHICSLVPSKDVIPLLKLIVQFYIEYGYTKESVISAVKDGFKNARAEEMFKK